MEWASEAIQGQNVLEARGGGVEYAKGAWRRELLSL